MKDIPNSILQILILQVIQKGKRMYPFQICRILKPRFERFIDLNDGLIARQITKLESENLVNCEVVIISGTKRKYYSLTLQGMEFFELKKSELEEFIVELTDFTSLPINEFASLE